MAERGDCVSDLNTDTSQVPTKTASIKLSSNSSNVNRARTPHMDRIEALRYQAMALKALYSLYSLRALRVLGARGRRRAHPGIKSRTTIRSRAGRQ